MNMTWGEIQIAAIQKMFLNNTAIIVSDLPTMKTDNKYKTYFNAMPGVANEGLLLLMKRARPHFKQYKITQYPLENLLGNMMETFQHTSEDITYETEKGLSYYFEVDNAATVEIYIDNILDSTITNTTRTPGLFTTYKGFLDNPTNLPVKIIFKGTHPYNYRNVAVYELDYQYTVGETKSIPDYVPTRRYDLAILIPDFYRMEAFYYEDGTNRPVNNSDYRMENDYTLMINSDKIGSFIVYYQNYPTKITSATTDASTIDLDPEVLCLLPAYIASQLYKDDDVSLATQYRNEFEVGVDNVFTPTDTLEFTSKSGWL